MVTADFFRADYESRMTPELIVAMAPYMEHLIHLQLEVIQLRAAVQPSPPNLAEVFAAGGVKLTQNNRGRWDYRMKLKDCYSGGGDGNTEMAAAVACLERFRELVFAECDANDDIE